MAGEENSCICLHMQLIAILSRIGVFFRPFSSKLPSVSVTAFALLPSTDTTAPIRVSLLFLSTTVPLICWAKAPAEQVISSVVAATKLQFLLFILVTFF